MEIRKMLNDMKPHFLKACPSIDPERVVIVTESALRATPKLLNCNPRSILTAVLTCVQLGLEPDGVAQYAHLVPFKNTCKPIFGYRGLIRLALQHEDVLNFLPPQMVYTKDEFDPHLGTQPYIVHKPHWQGPRGDIVAGYAVAHLRSGDRPFVHMSIGDLEEVRDQALAKAFDKEDSPWTKHPVAMYHKTLARRLVKWLPSSAAAQTAVSLDELAEEGLSQAMHEENIAQTLDTIDLSGYAAPTDESPAAPAPAADAQSAAEMRDALRKAPAASPPAAASPASPAAEAPVPDMPPSSIMDGIPEVPAPTVPTQAPRAEPRLEPPPGQLFEDIPFDTTEPPD